MKEQMERPKREDYGHAQAQIMGFNAQTSKYILALEAYIDHLTAEQGDGHTLCGINCDRTDCKATIIPWCELKDFPCDKSPRQEPPELTVREVQESLTMTEIFSMTQNQWTIATQTEVRQIGKSSDELTKIIRG